MTSTENGEEIQTNAPTANGKPSSETGRKDICRDFLNKICNRGTRCKFYHPPSEDTKDARRDDFNFCLDYQVHFSYSLGIRSAGGAWRCALFKYPFLKSETSNFSFEIF